MIGENRGRPHARATIAAITHFYKSHSAPIIGTAQDAMLPMDQFYDSIYHSIHHAALKRTARLIPKAKPYLPGSK